MVGGKEKGVGAIGRARASVAAVETLAAIRAQARTVATEAERVLLAGWSGWGPLAKAFAPDDNTWAELAERVETALPADDVRMGLRGTPTAFYTPRDLAAAMWDALRAFGYDGGPVAELGCGGGVFFSTAPAGVPLVGVERDPTAAAICRLLYPQARVVRAPLEEAHLPATFAAVIGNVPFGDMPVHDPTAPAAVRENLHNYFIWRAVQALAPGGFAVLLTSRYTMDGCSDRARVELGRDADFVGAVRLPNGALGGGTEAAADIVVLRRKGGTDKPTYGRAWRGVQETDWDRFTRVNEWWSEEPGAVFGAMGKGATTQYGLGLVVTPDPGDDVPARLREFVAGTLVPDARRRNLTWAQPRAPEEFDAAAAGVVSREGWHEGSMRLAGGGVLVVKNGRAVPLPNPGKELLRLLRLRDLAVELVTAEADHTLPDGRIEPTRAAVRVAYADYVKHHGPLNRYKEYSAGVDAETGLKLLTRRYPTMQGFRHDPDSALVFALEVFADDAVDASDADKASPAPIQTARQNRARPVRGTTGDPGQALAWCLDDKAGQVDLDHIALLLGRRLPVMEGAPDDRDAIYEQILAERAAVADLLGGRVYQDPETLRWVTAEDYLSGNVRGKHATAQMAAEQDGRFARNVDALAGAMPVWLGPAEITANLGAPWIGADDVRQFIAEVIGIDAEVKRVDVGNQWEVNALREVRASVAGTAQWGTPDVDAVTLIQLALNGKTPTVYKVVGTGESATTVKDADRSLLAAEKQQEIRARFSEWVWEEPDRCDRLVHRYNHRYNNLVPRRFDGLHVTVAGMAPGFDPYPHQWEFVARAGATLAALCGHPVGAGKTATMAMTAMKLKQVGLVRRPMIVVPNHLVEQVDREIRQLFPAARILTGASKTISANRAAFTARCATADWDIVLVTHSAFNAMDVDPATQAEYEEEAAARVREAVVAGAEEGRRMKGIVKRLAKALERMQTKVRGLRHTARARDAGVRFEQLGVDYVLVDEFHYYKNLAVPVRTEGFSVRPSKRATDLDVKLHYLRRRNGGGPYAALFSGTPVSNTMLELYVCLHYTMPEYMREIGLGSADAWAAAFVQFVTSVEVTVDGGDFQMRTRPAMFVNAPELRVLLAQTADIRTAEQLGLPRPDADLRIEAVDRTDGQASFSERLVARAEDVRQRRVEPDVDNMLAICTDGRRMATDPALVGIDDDGDTKLHAVARNMIQTWRENPGKLQIGFCDLGTPRDTRRRKSGKRTAADSADFETETLDGAGNIVVSVDFAGLLAAQAGADERPEEEAGPKIDYQTYGRLRRLLTDAGMDAGRIRFIHDAKDDAARAKLFRDCRSGKVDVILGSTDKLGVGTNIQRLVVAMHHIDAPFRPADVEQRDGRGLRPGNVHQTVVVYRYVTKRTFDAYMWQMLTRKLGFISQMLSGNLDRTVEDVDSDALLSFSAIKAAATDQPLLQDKAEVEAQIKKLALRERAHRQTVARMRKDAPRMRDSARQHEAQAKAWEAIEAAAETFPMDGDEFDKAVEDIHARMDGFRYYQRPVQVGGLTFAWRSWVTKTEHAEVQPLLVVSGGAGDMDSQGWKFWKSGDVKRRLRKMLGGSAQAAVLLREAQAKLLREAQQCDVLADKPFEQSGELAAARARLDQIDAELHEAAAVKSGPDATAGDVVIAAEPVLVEDRAVDDDEDDLGGLADLASLMMRDLDNEVASDLAELMGGAGLFS